MSLMRLHGLNAGVIPAINIFQAERLEQRFDIAAAAGSSETVMFMYELDPGESSCPYHYEYVEEWLLVVSGTVAVRTPTGEHTLHAGELARFPPGAAGAHKIMNRGDAPARTLLLSSAHAPAVSVYPDSNTIAVWPGDPDEEFIFDRDSVVPREQGWGTVDECPDAAGPRPGLFGGAAAVEPGGERAEHHEDAHRPDQ